MGPPADDVARWFLTADERGNPHTEIDTGRGDGDEGIAWTEGNLVRPLVHGAEYFRCLLDTWRALGEGDLLLFTDWRGDGDERLADEEGSELATVLVDLVERGVDVRGLVWRSHPHQAHLSEQEAIHLAEAVNEAGGEVLLDERVRRAGSHHQKLVAGAPPRARVRRRRLRRRDRPLPRPPRRPPSPRRPAGRRHRSGLRRPAAVARRADRDPRSGDRRPVPHVPRAVGRPDAARPSQPVAGPHRPGGAPSPAARPVAAPAGHPRVGGPARRAGPAHLSAQAPGVPVRGRGRAQHRPGLRQGASGGPAG